MIKVATGRPQVDLVKAGFLFLRHCVFELGGPLFTWQKTLPGEPESVASCVEEGSGGQCGMNILSKFQLSSSDGLE